MTSRERLSTTLRGEQADRVPVTMYEYSPHIDHWASHEPSYAPLLELERKYGDSFVYAPVDCPILLGDPNSLHGTEEKHADGTVVNTTQIDTPAGALQTVTRRDPAMMTNWQVEPLIKSDADIERVLAIPDAPSAVDPARLADLEGRVGDEGLLCFSVGDAIGHVVGLFDFEDFVMRCYADDGPVVALLDKAQELVLRAIREIGQHVENAAFRLWGPEYCGAPLMNPQVYFPRYVIDRDREATELIHDTGNICVIHCHGRLADLLHMIGEIGADALEPLELLPMKTADVTLEQIKERLGDRMCLMGAVQALTLEQGTAEEVREEVRQAIEIGAPGGGFVILPTAAPFHVPLTQQTLANAEMMYQATHEFGSYG
jgi:uroporphyrinogen-III decarboxylase